MTRSEWEPCLYSSRPPDEIDEAFDHAPDRFFPAPFPLVLGRELHCTRFGSTSELVAVHADRLLAHLGFRDLRSALASLLRDEMEKAASLVKTLEREGIEAREAGAVRRRGELLLASLGTARKEGREVEIVDYFNPEMPRLRIEVDPRLDLRGNAEALFKRARKLERAAAVIEKRLAGTRKRLSALQEYRVRVDAGRSGEDLQAVEAELNVSGLVRVFRRPERREVGRKPAFVRVREYRTRDGHVVLVGKTAAENDLLTFKIAAPHDFWLHAAGRSGAHVVVRNPKRSKDLPEQALMEAAGIAAWFSKGARSGEIEVHYAHRKEVRKGRGMSPGMVMLRRFRTIRAVPALPAGAPQGGAA
jgi:predicted ribosome quality control (RQC) complex YloA/Tae2 family protein